jgi:rSAM/selenodomain-associated transferase 2
MAARLSIVIPALNEAAGIAETLAALAPARARGSEVVVVDGGSQDATVRVAQPLADRVLAAPRGRARQMNAGAAAARGDVLLFLHADTVPPPDVDRLVHTVVAAGAAWGCFDVTIRGRHPALAAVAWCMNWRSRLTGVATGDQGLFVARAPFEAVGRYPDLPLMEDVALSKALRARHRPARVRARLATSGRRWEQHGVWRSIWLMWRLRYAYWRGADPAMLAKRYERAA